jgi:adenine-specific DNA-methyltransferase
VAHSPEKILSLPPLLNEQIAAEHETETPKVPIIEYVRKILTNPDSPDVPRLEAEIDRLIYELYGLTEEEIALVEGKK